MMIKCEIHRGLLFFPLEVSADSCHNAARLHEKGNFTHQQCVALIPYSAPFEYCITCQ